MFCQTISPSFFTWSSSFLPSPAPSLFLFRCLPVCLSVCLSFFCAWTSCSVDFFHTCISQKETVVLFVPVQGYYTMEPRVGIYIYIKRQRESEREAETQ